MQRPAAWFTGGFQRFLISYLRRNFHAVGVHRDSLPVVDFPSDVPLIVYANHPSWWDPLIAQFLNKTLFPGRHFSAPIDAEALEQYRVFEKLGFYGVKLSTTSGAAAFLKTSVSLMHENDTAIWITPEGRFADTRDHSAELMPGLAHLCKRSDRAVAIPLALEYVFWDERLPVCLVSLGTPIETSAHPDWSKTQWADELTSGLRNAQQRLTELAISRSSQPFDNLLRGKRRGGGIYDACRKVKSWMTGKPFKPQHGSQFQ